MSQANLEVATKFYQVYNDGNLDLLDQILGSDYVAQVNAHTINGATQAKGFIGGFLQGIPDTHYEVVDAFVADNKVVTRWRCTGTHTGNFFGMEPTGKSVDVTGITIFEIGEGLIHKLWNNWDQATLMKQLSE